MCPGQEYQRKLHPDDIPLRAQAERVKRGETCHFLVRRNPNYARRRQILTALDEVVKTYNSTANKSFEADSGMCGLEDGTSLLDVSMDSLSDDLQSLITSDDDECASSTSGSSDTSSEGSNSIRRTPSSLTIVKQPTDICLHCQNNYKSCEFCAHNSHLNTILRSPSKLSKKSNNNNNNSSSPLTTYSPVYNIREIRTASHSFSFLGNDKKLLDIELNSRFEAPTCRLRPQSVYMGRTVPRMILDATSTYETTAAEDHLTDINGNVKGKMTASENTTIAGEVVKNNPAKGLGHFVYI